jgi:hypothetical protein
VVRDLGDFKACSQIGFTFLSWRKVSVIRQTIQLPLPIRKPAISLVSGQGAWRKGSKDENLVMDSRHYFPDRAAGGHRRSETDLLIGVCFEFPKARLMRAFSMKECAL